MPYTGLTDLVELRLFDLSSKGEFRPKWLPEGKNGFLQRINLLYLRSQRFFDFYLLHFYNYVKNFIQFFKDESCRKMACICGLALWICGLL
jgi:hypothetical protein